MSLSYETAKKLKEAGFPDSDSWFNGRSEGYNSDCMITRCAGGHMEAPTLSELIEACGDDNKPTISPWNVFQWQASVPHKTLRQIIHGVGSTPEEAVANLWLALNKK